MAYVMLPILMKLSELDDRKILMNDVLIEIENLKTHFFTEQGTVKAVDGVDFSIGRGQTLCVVGESGCGKSITARSILQLIDKPGSIVDGSIRFHRKYGNVVDLAKMRSRGRDIRSIRGREIAMIFQEPMTSLSPVHTIGNQIMEVLLLHLDMSQKDAYHRTLEVLNRVGMPKPEQIMEYYPFQLSGGMRQRAMIAMGLSCAPSLLIADEPTTALDVTTQANILDLMQELQANLGMALMFITHDLGVVAEIADEVVVMYLGNVVERGNVDSIFHDPKHPYTRALLRSIPRLGSSRENRRRLNTIEGMVPSPYRRPDGCPFHPRCDYFMDGVCNQSLPENVVTGDGRMVKCWLYSDEVSVPDTISRTVDDFEMNAISEQVIPEADGNNHSAAMPHPLLEIENVKMHFPIQKGLLKRTVGHVKAVDDVSFAVRPGETLGLVGESGCGKTTLGRCILRVYDPTAGNMYYHGDGDFEAGPPRFRANVSEEFQSDNQNGGQAIDLTALRRRELKAFRSVIRMIFQDPYSSLNPRLPLIEIVGECLRVNTSMTRREIEDRVAELLLKVGLRPEYMHRYPHAFSGGERQRIGIARALALNPRLVIADEAVSALDVSVQAQTLNLLQDLQEEFGLTFLFIAHNLSVVEHISDRVAVMYVGKVVELAETKALYNQPMHPYTEALMSAVPNPDPRLRRKEGRVRLEGEVADPANPPQGCYFHPRCRYSEERCSVEEPELRDTGNGHFVACHFAEELNLVGVEDKTQIH